LKQSKTTTHQNLEAAQNHSTAKLRSSQKQLEKLRSSPETTTQRNFEAVKKPQSSSPKPQHSKTLEQPKNHSTAKL